MDLIFLFGITDYITFDSSMKNFVYWISLNVFVPLVPFLLKAVVSWSTVGNIDVKKLLTFSDVVIYSVVLCIIVLNINLTGKKNTFEIILRVFILGILVIDNILLTLLELNKYIHHTKAYVYLLLVFPIVSGSIYKFLYKTQAEI